MIFKMRARGGSEHIVYDNTKTARVCGIQSKNPSLLPGSTYLPQVNN